MAARRNSVGNSRGAQSDSVQGKISRRQIRVDSISKTGCRRTRTDSAKAKIDSNSAQIIIAILLVGLIVAARLLPHLPNFTPVAAVGLFAGVYLRKVWAMWLPLLGMILSDLFLAGYSWRGHVIVYGAFFLTGIIGRLISRRDFFDQKNRVGAKIARGVFGTLTASILFFLITNNVFLYTPAMYTYDFSGMIQSYVMGIPFFKFQILGDLIYASALFGLYEFAKIWLNKKVAAENLAAKLNP